MDEEGGEKAMNILAFIIALVAIGLFIKKPVSWGLIALTVAWIVQLVWQTSHNVVIH